jgi:hypothetical protein
MGDAAALRLRALHIALDVPHDERGMRLLRRPEVRVDTEICTEPLLNQAPPRPASVAGFGISVRPSTPA